LRLERDSIDDEFKILMFFQEILDWTPEFKYGIFSWNPLDGLNNCVLSKDAWDWEVKDNNAEL